jgi:hypothetical protein
VAVAVAEYTNLPCPQEPAEEEAQPAVVLQYNVEHLRVLKDMPEGELTAVNLFMMRAVAAVVPGLLVDVPILCLIVNVVQGVEDREYYRCYCRAPWREAVQADAITE